MAYGAPIELDRESSLQFWGELRRLSVCPVRPDASVWRISTAPKRRPKVVNAITRLHAVPGLLRLVGRAHLGRDAARRRTRARPTSAAPSPRYGGHATLIRAEPAVRRGGRSLPAARAGAREAALRLKNAFDPSRHPQPGPHVRHDVPKLRALERDDLGKRQMQTNFTAEQLTDSRMAEANKILQKCVHCGLLHGHLLRPMWCSATSATARAGAST